MMPVKTNRLKKQSLITGFVLWALIVLISLPVGRCMEVESTNGPASKILLTVLNEILDNPFHYFMFLPRTLKGWSYGAYALCFGGLVPLICYNSYMEKRDLMPEKENGSAKWNDSLKDYNKQYISVPRLGSESPNMIMTKDILLSMDTRKTMRNNNVLVIGGTGTGKSRFLIMPNLMQANASFVVTDPSGEILENMGSFLESEGYTIKVLNLVDMRCSDSYNPFKYAGGEEGILSMITALIANTTPKGSKSNDPFWEKAETALVQALCFYIREEFPVKEQNFSSVMYLLRQADAPEGKKSTLDIMFERFEEAHPEHIAAKSYAVYRSAGGGKTAQSIVISAQTRLQAFNLAAMKRITDADTIDLKSIGQKKTALFCVTPVGDTTVNFLVGMLYTQLFHTLYHYAETECPGKRLPVPVRFLLDEFANIGLIPNFNQLLATMRKYEISCTIVLQALSQLKALYRDDWEVIIANCDSLLFLGATDKTTLEYISAILGKQTIRSVNSSRSFGKQKGYTTNYNKTGRELATTTELRTMKNSSCVYFLRGLDPFFSTKFDPQSHPNYMKTGMGDDAKRYIVSDHKNYGGDL